MLNAREENFMCITEDELKAAIKEEINKSAEDIDIEKLRQMLKELNYLPLTDAEQKKMRQIWKNLIAIIQLDEIYGFLDADQ